MAWCPLWRGLFWLSRFTTSAKMTNGTGLHCRSRFFRSFSPRPVADILDLGAGTGKLTRLLEDRADHVVAVDPSEQMLEQLRR